MVVAQGPPLIVYLAGGWGPNGTFSRRNRPSSGAKGDFLQGEMGPFLGANGTFSRVKWDYF